MVAISQDTFGGPEVLKTVEAARPQPLPTEVLVRVVSAGVNPIDVKTRSGGGMAQVLGDPPFILGWDVSGVVEEVGFGVHTLEVGDEVYGMPWFPRQAGAYAEYVTAPSRHFARKPASVNHDQAAAVPLAALTAWQLVVDAAHVHNGQRVLLHAAAGGVGHFAVQILKQRGAHVIGTARADKHDWLRSLGADDLIDYTQERFEETVHDVDLVLDLVGDEHDNTSTRSLDTLRPGGLLVAVPSGVSRELTDRARERGMRAIGFLVEPDGHALTEIARLIDSGDLRIEIEDVLPLQEVAEAHRRIETGHTRGKLVLRVTT
ncbi:NADPH:quinone reductase [Streptoalloteichus tenebrarius]|uniref:NADPH:quinone reductase n=1 Tax=Streptoalloteichus tenebrarius (strain ATCC 17920 / DSM 40477 / JCM 4838 / CBS 697.72 / NBRC 16177 / NCIMB 11028 / NRRL B-12390 / A12253. 1 / ISP 5477) TaxID=1933 RepID=A0ABT1HNR4_STRSD|nr:NADP-dependent oxidoreductase [Streptoalloteichus tenebrarius]MCP2257151.1 NADPH:quinone reductase [Streptoalloteichus tenebrarius]BFE98784.1 NADP-dependent oxidoreductase [Streptoalloteichus tenebrarius]